MSALLRYLDLPLRVTRCAHDVWIVTASGKEVAQVVYSHPDVDPEQLALALIHAVVGAGASRQDAPAATQAGAVAPALTDRGPSDAPAAPTADPLPAYLVLPEPAGDVHAAGDAPLRLVKGSADPLGRDGYCRPVAQADGEDDESIEETIKRRRLADFIAREGW